jgi:hypothetical protein
VLVHPVSCFQDPGFKKSGFFKRGRLGTLSFLVSGAFFTAGLAVVETALGAFGFVPAAFLAAGAFLAFGAALTAFGFLGITVNSSSFPQCGHFAMTFLLYLVKSLILVSV